MNIALGVSIAALGASIVALIVLATLYSNSQTELELLQSQQANQSNRFDTLAANLSSSIQNIKTIQKEQSNQIALLGKKITTPNIQVDSTRVSCQSGELCTYQLKTANSTYPINFRFNGTIENMTASTDTRTLAIKVSTNQNGTFQIAIPREVVDSKTASNNDDRFAVFVDGVYTTYGIYPSGKDSQSAIAFGVNNNHPENYRILLIPIKEDTTSIEIVGTYPV